MRKEISKKVNDNGNFLRNINVTFNLETLRFFQNLNENLNKKISVDRKMCKINFHPTIMIYY